MADDSSSKNLHQLEILSTFFSKNLQNCPALRQKLPEKTSKHEQQTAAELPAGEIEHTTKPKPHTKLSPKERLHIQNHETGATFFLYTYSCFEKAGQDPTRRSRLCKKLNSFGITFIFGNFSRVFGGFNADLTSNRENWTDRLREISCWRLCFANSCRSKLKVGKCQKRCIKNNHQSPFYAE